MSTGSYQFEELLSFVSSTLDSAEGTSDPAGDTVLVAVFRIFMKMLDERPELAERYKETLRNVGGFNID